MNVLQSRSKDFRRQLPKSIQRTQRMKSGSGTLAFRHHLNQKLDSRIISACHKKSLRRIASPAIGTLQFRNKFRCRQAIKSLSNALRDHIRLRIVLPHDAIDSTSVISGSKERSKFILPLFRQPVRVLNHVAIHVDNPKCSVRTGAHHNRAAPTIFGRKEVVFCINFRWITFQPKANSIINQQVVLNEITKGFTRKDMLGIEA